MASFLNNCIIKASTSGTADFVLTGATQFGGYAPSSCLDPAVVDGATYHYFARTYDASGNVTANEEGDGVWTTSTSTLTRATIRNSSNGGTKLNFSSAPTVFMGGPIATDISAAELTVGTSPILSGISGRVLYDNAGVVGEMTTTGSGTVLALAASPTLSGTVSVQNSTTAQALDVYNTYTSATNYEVGVFDWTTNPNVLTIGTNKGSGGGSVRNLKLIVGGNDVADYGITNASGWWFNSAVTFAGDITFGGTAAIGFIYCSNHGPAYFINAGGTHFGAIGWDGVVAADLWGLGGSLDEATFDKQALLWDGNANVIIGTAAIATNATNGFLYLDGCAGTPTGTPTSYAGRTPVVYDTTNHKLCIYDGSWRTWSGASSQRTVASPTAPNSTSVFTMQGLAGAITPTKSGTIRITICGTIITSATTIDDGIIIQISHGTGTAPTSNAALTGTQDGTTMQYTNPATVTAADLNVPFSTTALVTGLTLATAYWIDLAAKAVTSASHVGLSNVTIVAEEI